MSITDYVTGLAGVALAIGLLYYKYRAGKLGAENAVLSASKATYKASAAYHRNRSRELENAREKATVKRIKEISDEGTRIVDSGDAAAAAEFLRRGVARSGPEPTGKLPGIPDAAAPGSPPVPVPE